MAHAVYQFGEFLIDPAARELWRAGCLVALPPNVFDCLTYLLEHNDRAVGRDELVATVWGKTDVSDTLLGQTILRIRRELGDDAREQRVVRTIPRFGYRWVAPLEALAERATATSVAPVEGRTGSHATSAATEMGLQAAPADARDVIVAVASPLLGGDAVAAAVSRAQRRQMWGVAAVLGIVLATVVAWRLHPRHAALADRVQFGAMVSAVLPASIEAGGQWTWMRLGLMDAIASHLRGAGVPSVPSENVVALLAAPNDDRSDDLRVTLGADLLVTPRVDRVADEWRVQLVADDGAKRQYIAESLSRDAMVAARAATDKLLTALGRKLLDAPTESAESALVQRVDAAVLADDPDTALALIANASEEERRAPELRLRLAKIDFRGGRYDAARKRLVALLDEAPPQTAPVLRASILNGLGAVALRTGQPIESARAFDAAIGLLDAHPDPGQLGQAWIGRAAAAEAQHQFETAASDYARARVVLRQANDTLALLRVDANDGFLDYDLDHPTQALQTLTAAAEGFKRWGALNEAILCSVGQIDADLALLDGRAALRVADTAAPLTERIDNPGTIASFALARGRALVAIGRLREARSTFDELRGSGHDAQLAAVAGGELARLELDSGNAAAAAELAGRGVELLAAPENSGARARVWLTWVRALLRVGNAQMAVEQAEAFAAWAARSATPRAELLASLARAEAARGSGSQSWRAQFAMARELAARNDVPIEIAAVARSYADALLAEGNLDAAAVEVGRVTRWSERDFFCALLEARLYAALGSNEARQAALARAKALAGERLIPADAFAIPVSTPLAR